VAVEVQITLTGIATCVATVSVALWLAYRRQQRVLSRLVKGLTLASNDTDVRHVNLNHLADVPAPVARYLRPCSIPNQVPVLNGG